MVPHPVCVSFTTFQLWRLLLCSLSGVVMLIGVDVGVDALLMFEVSTLLDRLITAIAITLADFGWLITSIMHRPLEFTLRTIRMALSWPSRSWSSTR